MTSRKPTKRRPGSTAAQVRAWRRKIRAAHAAGKLRTLADLWRVLGVRL